MKIWGKRGDTGITSMSKLCAMTIYVIKWHLKDN